MSYHKINTFANQLIEMENIEDNKSETSEYSSTLNIKGGVLGLIRTTQRNYINLTNIADNKAHILISINSLMPTVFIPIVLVNYEIIIERKFLFPLICFAVTCLLTIIVAAMVLTPFSGSKQHKEILKKVTRRSPFFFTNYADLTLEEYKNLFQETLSKKEITSQVIISDLYYFGLNLNDKYRLVKYSYRIFNVGMLFTFIIFLIMLVIY